MEKYPYGEYRRKGLWSKLATLALKDRDAEILEALLEVHGDADIQWYFHFDFDALVHNAKDQKDADIVRIVQNSRFRPRKFLNHPLDLMK